MFLDFKTLQTQMALRHNEGIILSLKFFKKEKIHMMRPRGCKKKRDKYINTPKMTKNRPKMT